jgi:hypothetical protein
MGQFLFLKLHFLRNRKMKNLLIIVATLIFAVSVYAENIDPKNTDNQYAYGENVGWINFEPDITDSNTLVQRDKVTGYIWAENIGWINLSPITYGGVLNDGYGNLSGYAWGENVGWINFAPVVGRTSYGVKIDADGNFSGYAWGENIGWIDFNSSELSGQGVKVCVVNYLHLRTIAEQWLKTGTSYEADLDENNKVEFRDFNIFASYWMDYCPSNWPL